MTAAPETPNIRWISLTMTSGGKETTVPCGTCRQDEVPAFWDLRFYNDEDMRVLVVDPHENPATGQQCGGSHKVI